jgi:hypothetical protein
MTVRVTGMVRKQEQVGRRSAFYALSGALALLGLPVT